MFITISLSRSPTVSPSALFRSPAFPLTGSTTFPLAHSHSTGCDSIAPSFPTHPLFRSIPTYPLTLTFLFTTHASPLNRSMCRLSLSGLCSAPSLRISLWLSQIPLMQRTSPCFYRKTVRGFLVLVSPHLSHFQQVD